ncbi:MAG TPA: hypothetical protein VFL57_03840 [Bryobacteraceae bacterium]|nr:hypothetical protein [Bryobacteraceae bacterium]
MNGISLATHGDSEERARWPTLQPHFPLYEPFWMQHVYTLRGTDHRIRADIDERLELLAQEHYKCFLSLSIAHGRLDDDAHPERTFSSLQNAGNRAQQVIRLFNDIRAGCLPADADPVDPAPFADSCRAIAEYRNYVHEDVMGMIVLGGRRYLPKPACLGTYRRWSRLQGAPVADFEPMRDVLAARFATLTALLDTGWRIMLDRTPALLASPGYRHLLPPQAGAANVVMQRIVLSSNVQLG